MASVISTVRGRARGQASANTETTQGTVTKTYTDKDGNVYAADVRLYGLTRTLVRCKNSSGIRLWVGLNVLLAWTRGSRFSPVILQAAGAEGGAVLSSAASAATEAAGQTTNSDPDLSGVGFLLAGPDESVPDGYEMVPGANTLFEDTPPGTTSGGAVVNGRRTLTMRPLVMTALPDAGTTLLPDGTLLDLVDEGGEPLGLYRLDKTVPAWKRRDAGGGSGGGGTPGTPGTPGSRWYQGEGEPAGGIGINGDFYLNVSPITGTGDLYQKAAGIWTLIGNLRGAQGIQGIQGVGAVIRNGAGVPSDALGVNGDYYINTTAGAGKGDLYYKSAGAYAVVLNIVGPAGGGGGGAIPIGVIGTPDSAPDVDTFEYDPKYFLVEDLGPSGTTANKTKALVSLREDVIPPAKKLWYGYVDVSDRMAPDAFLAGITPQLAPGLVIGDFLVIGCDYTGTTRHPYPGYSGSPAPLADMLLGNMTMSPARFQNYTHWSQANPILITGTVNAGPRTGTKVKVRKPEGLLGVEGGRCLVEIDPESVSSYGTYIFRIIRITSVPVNQEQAYTGDVYELGFTLDEAKVLEWGGDPPKTIVDSGQFTPDGTYAGGPGGIQPFIYRAQRRDVRVYSTGTNPLTVALPAATEKHKEEVVVLLQPGSGSITINLPTAAMFYNLATGLCADIIFVRSGSGTGGITVNILSGESNLNGPTSFTLNGLNQSLTLSPWNAATWFFK